MAYQSTGHPGLEQTVGEYYPSVSVKAASVVVVPNDKLVFSLDTEGGGPAKAKANLAIHNPTDQAVIYKFKTNASTLGVKPNVGVKPCAGLIRPGDQVDVEVCLDYGAKADVDDLRVLVVTAPAPLFDFDPKVVWKSIAAQMQDVTEMGCVVNTDPVTANADGFSTSYPTDFAASVLPPVPPKYQPVVPQPMFQATVPGVELQEQRYYRTAKAGDSSIPCPPEMPGSPQLRQRSVPAPPTQPKPKARVAEPQGLANRAAVFAQQCLPTVQHVEQQAPRVSSMTSGMPQPFTNIQQGHSRPEIETRRSSQYSQATVRNGPTSYFVDVSPMAQRERKRTEMDSQAIDTVFGLDKNIVLQICLLGIAAIAAVKLLIE